MDPRHVDIVLDKHEIEVFNGTPEQIIEWLNEKATTELYGGSYHIYCTEDKNTSSRKHYIDHHRFHLVLEQVRIAILAQDPNAQAVETTRKIVELFKY